MACTSPTRWLLISLLGPAVLAQSVPGPFSAEQAGRGAKLYSVTCAGCHGSDLLSGGAPPLAGNSFLSKLGGQSVYALFRAIREMPPGAGGTLPSETYTDLTAYILERNGHAAGPTPLKVSSQIATQTKVAPPEGTARAMPPPPEILTGNRSAIPLTGAGPTQNELNAAYTSKANWLYHTHDYSGARYSASTEITPDNAGRLRVACAFQLGEQSNFQTGPLVYNGRMYVTGIRTTAAIDARTAIFCGNTSGRPAPARAGRRTAAPPLRMVT
jgi:alcohol dehydrogenase (cytochrome c)